MLIGDFPAEKAAATAHQLLIHTGGLVKEGHSTRSPDIDEFITNVKAAPIDSPPGQEWRYSNVGYSFATALMEVVAENLGRLPLPGGFLVALRWKALQFSAAGSQRTSLRAIGASVHSARP